MAIAIHIISAVKSETEEETELSFDRPKTSYYALRFCGDWDCLLRSLDAGELSACAEGTTPGPYVLA
jgi:hypothetical protein